MQSKPDENKALLRVLTDFVTRPVRRMWARKVHAGICSVTNLVPIKEFDEEEDVFLVGYPKSGNTWLQNLVAGVVYGMDPEYTPDAVVQELVPDIHYKRYYKRYRTPTFFKSHHLPRPEYRRVVYLLRDGRDAMVSYHRFLTALYGQEIDFLGMVKDGKGLFPCKWHEHVEAWSSNPYSAQMIVVTYEDLKSNGVAALRKICAFVGVDRDDSFLESVAKKASFERMRQKEMRLGWDNPAWPKDKFFVRRGIVGSFKDEMPEIVLKTFLDEAGKTLHKCSYL